MEGGEEGNFLRHESIIATVKHNLKHNCGPFFRVMPKNIIILNFTIKHNPSDPNPKLLVEISLLGAPEV